MYSENKPACLKICGGSNRQKVFKPLQYIDLAIEF